jgi:hypothetical protein
MYVVILVVLAGLSLFMLGWGFRRRKAIPVLAGLLLGALTATVFGGMDFWGEKLWFESLGYSSRFWTEVWSRAAVTAVGGVGAAVAVWLLTFSVHSALARARWIAAGIAGLVGLQMGSAHWMTWLRFANRVPGEVSDPILGHSTGFYLFTLPFLDVLYQWFLWVVFVSLLASAVGLFVHLNEEGKIRLRQPGGDARKDLRSFYLNAGLLLMLLGAGRYLERFHLLYSDWGVVNGPGWTDVHIRLPAYLVVGALTVLAGIVVITPPARRRIVPSRLRRLLEAFPPALVRLAWTGALVLALWILGLGLVPGFVQWLRVEPNEITLEEPYIRHNIEFTRRGFDLHDVQEREFPATGEFTPGLVDENPEIFRNIRLWDYRALDAVYKQFQEIRLYYEFHDVDIDRYDLSSGYREVMVSAREMELGNLPPESQTFVNRRFKYTHGYGATLTNVSEFTPEGLPNLLVKDIPPVVEDTTLSLARPEIYYGELTNTHVVVNSATEEFDYPSGDTNRYVQYEGPGGVQISNVWRKFLFGWKFDGTRFFFSGYPRPESRIMFHRQIGERVRELAPFLSFDGDPYVVMVDGGLKWIIDAYTTSRRYPYSEPFASTRTGALDGGGAVLSETLGRGSRNINYIRNSVKAVVDAYSGEVTFYVFEPDDPLIQVYRGIFPDLFQDGDAMPADLRAHVRYPEGLLLTQGLVFAKYHMEDPTVFYNQEDLWVRATEKYYGGVQPVEPYYIMWKPPGAEEAEFSLILPFTPKNRQVLIGWIAGLCDGDRYGEFLAYRFPKERRILGPQQVETKIDQDSFLSGQLTLWDQRGSNVIRGNVLAIPVGETIVYVEPIYLQSETSAYPELRLVAVMHGDNLSYAETFDEALRGLFQPGAVQPAEELGRTGGEAAGAAAPLARTIADARTAFQNYLDNLGQGRFQEAASALERLSRLLERLEAQAGPGQAAGGGGTEGG